MAWWLVALSTGISPSSSDLATFGKVCMGWIWYQQASEVCGGLDLFELSIHGTSFKSQRLHEFFGVNPAGTFKSIAGFNRLNSSLGCISTCNFIINCKSVENWKFSKKLPTVVMKILGPPSGAFGAVRPPSPLPFQLLKRPWVPPPSKKPTVRAMPSVPPPHFDQGRYHFKIRLPFVVFFCLTRNRSNHTFH